jgi:hypothetical protein
MLWSGIGQVNIRSAVELLVDIDWLGIHLVNPGIDLPV